MTKHLARNILRFACVVVAAIAVTSPQAQGAIESRNILKTFFETGDVPTQEQFGDVIDSYIHQTDDGLTLVGIGVVPDGSSASRFLRIDANVGINETLPDTHGALWRGHLPPIPGMCPSFCGTDGFLPLKYENADGTAAHYGFLRIEMENEPGGEHGPAIFVSQWVWESSPNTTLTTFAVPEPTALAMLAVGITLALLRRRRAC